jgi:hypothetical protein
MIRRLTHIDPVIKIQMRLSFCKNRVEVLKLKHSEGSEIEIESLNREINEIEEKLNIKKEVVMPKKEIAKSVPDLKETHILNVYDDEEKKWVEISPENQRMAAYVHQQVLMSSFVTATAIKKMFDERLYLALGCQGREEYIATMLPMGRSQAYKYYAIATKYESATKLLAGDNYKPLAIENGAVHLSGLNEEEIENVAGLSISKLYELSTLEDNKLAELMKKGKIKNAEGDTLDIQALVDVTDKEAQKKIAAFKKEYSAKVNQLTEENKLLKEERKTLARERDDNKNKVDDLKVDLAIYGPNATKLKDKAEHLAIAQKLLNEVNLAIVKAGVLFSDPQGLRTDLINTIQKIDEVHNILSNHYSEILAEA